MSSSCGWYTSSTEDRYMTDAKVDEVRGRISREVEQAQRRVALLESELKRIGASFADVGAKLSTLNIPSLDRIAVQKDVDALWQILGEYNEARRELSNKTGELNRLREVIS